MSRYPFWWTTTVTVYSKYEDTTTQEITWNRTVLKGCFWKTQVANEMVNGTYTIARTPVDMCRIPKSSKFMTAYAWNNATSRVNKFSLKPGDIVIKGKVTDTIDEYTKGSRASDLIDKYKDVGLIQISVFSNNTEGSVYLPHYYVA